MLRKMGLAIAATMLAAACSAGQGADEAVGHDISATEGPAIDRDNPAVQEVLAIRERAAQALQDGDAETFAEGIDEGFVASNPADQIARKEAMVGFVASAQLRYTGIETELAFAQQVAPDIVVLMGNEYTTQNAVPDDNEGGASFLGSRINRRFTDVYRRGEDGVWRHLAKQSTLVGMQADD